MWTIDLIEWWRPKEMVLFVIFNGWLLDNWSLLFAINENLYHKHFDFYVACKKTFMLLMHEIKVYSLGLDPKDSTLTEFPHHVNNIKYKYKFVWPVMPKLVTHGFLDYTVKQLNCFWEWRMLTINFVDERKL